MMKNSLLVDPTFEEFHAMEKAAITRMKILRIKWIWGILVSSWTA